MSFRFSIAIFILLYCAESLRADTCLSVETCADCTQNPVCAWCSQSDFHGQDKKPLPRCNTIVAHAELGNFKCKTELLFHHVNDLNTTKNESLSNGDDKSRAVPIQPQHLSIKLRVRDPIRFDMAYQEVIDYPLDLYYLMDGTYSMKDDQEVIVGLKNSIGERMRNITSKFRQGYGTFVDKTTMPYVVTTMTLWNNPCHRVGDQCVPPYGFKNRMKLSNDTEKFSDLVKATKLSASSDAAEGGFDALIQVMVCEKQIGWSAQARHLIIFATDAPFHFAGDGRLGGLILPNDGNCHMDEKGEDYTDSLVTDYPSFAQLNAKAKENSMNIIFAVTTDAIEDYKILTGTIEGSKTTELARNSSNIVDLVENEYKKITSKVEIKHSFPPEFFKVRYYSKCSDENGPEVETNNCTGLQAGMVIRFRVEIELIKCSLKKSEWKKQYRIYAVGVPDRIDIDVETLCDCPYCENPDNRIPDSPLCSSHGYEICGLCNCSKDYFGKNCECHAVGGKRKAESSACKLGNTTDVCSGRGTCDCGQCKCSDINRYSGKYCECDNKNCLIVNEEICANHGSCECGTCVCYDGWKGQGCDCSTETNSCAGPDSEKECSGHGTCTCGKCQCVGRYTGEYCEKCLHESCPNRCEDFKHCVQCQLHGTGVHNPSECQWNCHEYSITPVDVISHSGISDEFICKAEDHSDDCVFIFSYLQTKTALQINAQKEKECPPQGPIFWIIAALASLVVIAGLILLSVYKVYTKIQVKREFAAYEKERTGVSWGMATNPLYNNPVGTFQNPMYAGKDT